MRDLDLDLLGLDLDIKYISSNHCKTIMRRCCRNAAAIRINGSDPEVVSVINKWCSNIRSLLVDDAQTPYLTLRDLKKLRDDGKTGLVSLKARNMSIEQITTVFKTHSRTLENVHLRYFGESQTTTSPADIHDDVPFMERLNDLRIYNYPPVFDLQLARLVARCKSVKYLVFGCRNGRSPEMVQVVSTLMELKQVLTVFHDDMSSMIPLYQMFADMGGRSSLQKVGIFCCRNITQDVLATIARISTLREIFLRKLPTVTAPVLNSFLRILEGHKNMGCVEIVQVPAANDETFEILYHINNR